MAVTYGFFNSVNGDRKYNADQMSEYFRGIVNEGVFQHLDGGLAVTAGTGLAVSVAAGRAIIQNRWVQNSAALPLSIAEASETYGRKDAVVIRYNISARSVSITVKTGTPAASPAAPALTRNSTTYEMALAYVNVSAGATSVTVTDKRSDTTVCGWATVAQQTSGEVDAMLNAMKTGFDGVVYPSPAAMVQGCDQLLQDQITEISDDVEGVKTFIDLSSIFSLVSHIDNGATLSGSTLTIPQGSTGDTSYVGMRTFDTDSYKGKKLFFKISYSFTGADISSLISPVILTNVTGITEISKSFSNNEVVVVIDAANELSSGYLSVALKLTNNVALESNATMTMESFSVGYYEDLKTSIELLVDEIIEETPIISELYDIEKTDITGYFSQVSNDTHGSTISGNVLTVPAGETGNQDYIGIRVLNDIALVKGKTFDIEIGYTLSSGLPVSKTAINMVNNGTGVTFNSYNWDGQKARANVTVADNATATYVVLGVKISTTTAFSSAVTLTMDSYVVKEFVSLDNGIANVTGSARFWGKKMSCFGDSYTSQEGWQPKTKEILGLESYVNVAIYGGVLTTGYAGIQNVALDSNILTIFYGTNDYSNNKELGTIDDDATNPTTFYGALKYVFEWVSTNIPKCLIVPITHTQRWASAADLAFIENNGYGTGGQPKNNLGYSLRDYADAIIEVAERYGYRVLDFNRWGQVNKNNEGSFYGNDHLHPTPASYQLLGIKIAKFIQEE